MAKKKKKDDVLSTNVIIQKLATRYYVIEPFTDDVAYEFLVYDDMKTFKFIFGLFTVGDDKVMFNGDLYSTEKELLAAVEAYNSELMFPTHTYDPSTPGTTRTEMQLHWYVTEILGYKYEHNFMGEEIYIKEDAYGNSIGHIGISITDAKIPNNVTSGVITMTVGTNKLYRVEFETADEGARGINALAFPGTAHILTDAVQAIDTMQKYGFAYENALRFDFGKDGALESISKVKDDVIERLEAMLKKLKAS